jgi:hypothetical protein
MSNAKRAISSGKWRPGAESQRAISSGKWRHYRIICLIYALYCEKPMKFTSSTLTTLFCLLSPTGEQIAPDSTPKNRFTFLAVAGNPRGDEPGGFPVQRALRERSPPTGVKM